MPVAPVDGHGEAFDSLEHLLAVVREPRRPRLGKLAEQLLGRFHGVLGGSLERQNKRVDCLGVAQLAQNRLADGGAVGWQRLADFRRKANALRGVDSCDIEHAPMVERARLAGLVAGADHAPHLALYERQSHCAAVESLAQQIGAQPNRVTHGVFVVGDVLRVCHGVQDGKQAAFRRAELAADLGHGKALLIGGKSVENCQYPERRAVPHGFFRNCHSSSLVIFSHLNAQSSFLFVNTNAVYS